MESKPRAKMSRLQRAKQFMPFAALRGLPEALKAQEKIRVPKAELAEDEAEELNRRLLQVRRGQVVSVLYYDDGEYLQRTGAVSRFDPERQVLEIEGYRIGWNDLRDVNPAQVSVDG